MSSSTIFSGRRLVALGGVALALIAAAIAAMAMHANAAAPTIGVKTSKVGSKTEPIAVNHKGRAVYTLSGDRAGHLKCKSSACLAIWPAVKAKGMHKPKLASGVKGKIGTVKVKGFKQVTLNGRPLYTYAADHKAGVATGNGIRAFGGVWHVVREGKAKSTSTTPTSSTTTSPGPYASGQ